MKLTLALYAVPSPSKFRVYFVTGFSCTVEAFSTEQAKILGQAIQIKAGREYQVTFIKELKQ